MIRITLAALIVSTSPAFACEEFVSIDNVQTRELIETMRSPASDPLDQVFAYETLICSDQAAVRDLTLRTGATSENPVIRGQTLFLAIAQMSSLVVELLPAEGLPNDHYDLLGDYPALSFPVTFVDPARTCLALGDREACKGQMVDVKGETATLHAAFPGTSSDVLGRFSYSGGSLVEGTMQLNLHEGNFAFPARITLF